MGESMVQEKALLRRARDLRNRSTPFEAKLWQHLRASQLGGYKFRRQHVIDNCIADFFCPQKGLIVEIDGDTHEPDRDAARDLNHEQLGYTTLRFSNVDVGSNIEGVLQHLLTILEELPDRWPHPNPSPEGEGL